MLRLKYLLLGLVLGTVVALGLNAVAETPDLQKLIGAGDYSSALEAFGQSSPAFKASTNGVATFAFLIYKNNLQVSGLQLLFAKTSPAKLNADLLKRWTTELESSPIVQKGWVLSTGGWKKIVNNDPVNLKIKSVGDANRALGQAERMTQPNARARIWWKVATLAPLNGDVDSALKALTAIEASKQTVYGADLVASVHARVLYQKGDVAGAEAFFAKIPKSSSLWIESLEEQAWGHVRQNEFDAALGQTITLMSPAFASLVGPESYFLANLMALKVCDYPRLFHTSDLFKQRHRSRLIELQAFAKTGSTPGFEQALAKFEVNGVSIEAAGALVSSVPRAAFRDRWFVRDTETRRLLLKETELASANPALAAFAQSAKVQADQLRGLAEQRARQLAKNELNEYRIILDKLHIVEGEVIERLHLDESLQGQRGDLSKADDKGDVLVFPYKSKEVWFDELNNYKAQVKNCPSLPSALKGASL